MVKNKLIQFENDIATLHCLPQNKENDSFDIRVDVVQKKLLQNTLGYKNAYVVHAMYKIFEIFEETHSVPNEAVSMWY